ncbi:DUF4287 domain-containing protein [Microbacterium sp. 4R-513]|uniref:DUF4287 domain-containing protein n=1 Tax=Microbacterium sp. 4R-513 TaxID=2567934 RepID=UPI0013E0F77A|nr:DUF4287 domain-containing protein [Microbacterium sp. 4R-513]QIG40946.1 DUF4287 domain-containing protein [Microbacterium sp. 4R-513]
MPEHRVTPPPPSDEKLKGPASYFPSIEKNYGRPIQDWLDLVADQLDTKKHMEVVEYLKSEYGMGHGHAQALVGYTKAQLGG